MDELDAIRERKLRDLQERATPEADAQAPGEPLPLSDATFDATVRAHDLLLVDFWAPWCGPCRMVAPVVEQLARDYRGKVVFGKLNTDENPRTATRFGILSIPTLMLFKKGKPAEVVVGAAPRAKLEGVLRKHLA